MHPRGQDEKVDPRFILAADRTLLAWIRTALAMMGFGDETTPRLFPSS